MHYDIRLVCSVAEVLEATEEVFLTKEQALRSLDSINSSRYIMVACDAPENDPVHDVWAAYYNHRANHRRS